MNRSLKHHGEGLARSWGAVQRINRTLLHGCRIGVAICLAILSAVVLLQVVCRYVFGAALPWPEEVAKLLMVWMAFLGAPVAYVRAEHARITLLSSLWRGRSQALFGAAIDATVLVLALLLAVYAIPVVRVGWVVRATTVPVSMAWVYAAFPVGMVLIAMVALEAVLAQLAGMREGALPHIGEDGACADGEPSGSHGTGQAAHGSIEGTAKAS